MKKEIKILIEVLKSPYFKEYPNKRIDWICQSLERFFPVNIHTLRELGLNITDEEFGIFLLHCAARKKLQHKKYIRKF